MREHSRGRKGPQFIDPEFAEALYEDKASHSSSDRQAERKAQQFCRQVQRALNLALADRNVGDGLDDLFVEEVLPAPDCGHLLVHVVIPAALSVVDAMAVLGREAPELRSEVASAISRKRAPELYFIPAYQDGGAMIETSMPAIRTWLAAPMGREVSEALERLRRAPDVQAIAVMPDVHLAAEVCIGVVVATSHLIYPQAVGGDIGCGMLAVALDLDSTALDAPKVAGQVLAELGHAVPARRRNRRLVIPQPAGVANDRLSHPVLDSIRRKEGETEFATLGSGNHFVEIQADEDGRLWLMVHSGSRALGQAIRDHHLSRAQPVDNRLRALDAKSDAGVDYLHDASCARRFADASRRAIAEEVGRVLDRKLGAHVGWDTLITSDHNHVSLEQHGGCDLWVHRKGAMSARLGESGVLPGSMGTVSFHVEGRGCEEALCSSAHGAGRVLSRTAARRHVTERALRQQMEGIWYDSRKTDDLRDEAPSAYKDIRAVLRAQKDMVKVTRTLRPVLNYKGL